MICTYEKKWCGMKCSVARKTLTRSSRGNDGSKDHAYNDSDILHLLLLYLSLCRAYYSYHSSAVCDQCFLWAHQKQARNTNWKQEHQLSSGIEGVRVLFSFGSWCTSGSGRILMSWYPTSPPLKYRGSLQTWYTYVMESEGGPNQRGDILSEEMENTREGLVQTYLEFTGVS